MSTPKAIKKRYTCELANVQLSNENNTTDFIEKGLLVQISPLKFSDFTNFEINTNLELILMNRKIKIKITSNIKQDNENKRKLLLEIKNDPINAISISTNKSAIRSVNIVDANLVLLY